MIVPGNLVDEEEEESNLHLFIASEAGFNPNKLNATLWDPF